MRLVWLFYTHFFLCIESLPPLFFLIPIYYISSYSIPFLFLFIEKRRIKWKKFIKRQEIALKLYFSWKVETRKDGTIYFLLDFSSKFFFLARMCFFELFILCSIYASFMSCIFSMNIHLNAFSLSLIFFLFLSP